MMAVYRLLPFCRCISLRRCNSRSTFSSALRAGSEEGTEDVLLLLLRLLLLLPATLLLLLLLYVLP